ncbi:MAG: BTAD domain-containing putative transcriptional regulator [Gammaproteobacteria bacterium]|nr:BTAD domain-containing putative transcriptional regulator [Gammaproteobacteria bacterium]
MMKKASPRLAKFSRPHLPDLVSRNRLHMLLDKGRENSIVWVTGPPGAGKTTLVAQYIETFSKDTIWYQLDQGDNDVATCFHYLHQAVSTPKRDPSFHLPAFTPQYLGDLTVFSRGYFREIYSNLDAPFVMVFDNYHEVAAQSRLHEVMQCALDEVPDHGCVIFISRTDPPAFTARFMANGQMLLLGWNDLQLTRDESDAIIELRDYKFTDLDKQQLYERTQGWAAGLVLMLEAMRREGTPVEIPENFTPHLVFDYLAGEIFRTLDDINQDFLMHTAMLPQVTASMATQLTDYSYEDAATTLEFLSSHDYLISANRGGDEVVYQYHPLLRDFLLNRAQESLSIKERVLLDNRAAVLLEQAGNIEDATQLCIKNSEWDELARLIRAHAATMQEQGRGETLEQWLEELPKDMLERDPWLIYWLASCKSVFTLRESRRLYEQAYQMFRDQANPDVDGLFGACSGIMDNILYELDDLTLLDYWIAEVEQLLVLYPDFPSAEYGASVTFGVYQSMGFRQPFHPGIEKWAERVYAIVYTATDPSMKVRAAIALAPTIGWTGRFSTALEIIATVRTVASAPDVSPITLATLRYIESVHYMLTGEHELCMDAVHDAVDIALSRGIHTWKNSSLINGVVSALGVEDLGLAEELLAQIDTHAMVVRRFDSCLHSYCLAWLAKLKKNVLEAYHHQRAALRVVTEIGAPFFKVMIQLGLAQTLFACDDERKGVNLLRQIRKSAKTIPNRLLEFMTFLAYAQIAMNHGRKASGLRALKYALGIGRKHNFNHIIGWQPRELAALAVIALENGIEVEYVRQWIIRRNLIPDDPPWHLSEWPWKARIRTLGQFDLQLDAESAKDKPRGRPIELLKVSLALGGRGVGVERITDVLWPNIDADYSHRSFNTTLHRLRKLIGDDHAVLFHDGKLTLNENYFWLDIWAFDRALGDLSNCFKTPGLQPSAPQLLPLANDALSLYQGPFMGDEDSAWAINARDHWKSRFVRFACETAESLKDSQQLDEAITFLQACLDAEDLAEGIYRQLMLYYQQLGRKAESIEIFNRCSNTLGTRLGVEPSAETKRIYEDLMAGGDSV